MPQPHPCKRAGHTLQVNRKTRSYCPAIAIKDMKPANPNSAIHFSNGKILTQITKYKPAKRKTPPFMRGLFQKVIGRLTYKIMIQSNQTEKTDSCT
ncbi:MAG: hypothetical protein ACTTJV_05330 [Ottowia sp.]